MDINYKNSILEKSFLERKYLIIVNIVLGLALVVSAVSLYFKLNNYKIVIVPETLRNEAYITNQSVSNSYIKSFTEHIINLKFNVTPATVSSQYKKLLFLTNKSKYSFFKDYLEKERDTIIKQGISLLFVPLNIEIDDSKLTAHVKGDYKMIIGKKVLMEQSKVYSFNFSYHEPQLFLDSIKESNE